ncbi:hypothetical protein HMI54_001080, partial [Coelomomyces lativittatus]
FRDRHQEVDSLVNELLNTTSISSKSSKTSSITTTSSSLFPISTTGISEKTNQSEKPNEELPSPTPVLRVPTSFQMTEILCLDLPPKERIVYSKEIQTDTFLSPISSMAISLTPTTSISVPSIISPPPLQLLESQQMIPEEVKEPESIFFTEEEKKKILESDGFLNFFNESSHVMEKALAITERFDFLKDYSTQLHPIGLKNEKHVAQLVNIYFSEKYTEGRTVTAIQWNPQFPELFFVAYSKSSRPTTQPDGLVLVWNLVLPSTPEFVLTCQSEVTTSVCSPFQPNIIAAGTYSGQLVVWDTKLKMSKPTLKTPLSHSGHTHPITSAAIIGTATLHHLITSSNDGSICVWPMDLLSHPTETLQLSLPLSTTTPSTSTLIPSTNLSLYANELGVTCFAFPVNETTQFYVGTDSGMLMHVQRYDRPGSPSGILSQWHAHVTCITQVVCHPMHVIGPFDFSNLILTCSMDWTIKLWKHTKCIAQFDVNNDYVMDIQWSPVHPAVFATCNALGCVDIYNLNLDFEMYICRILVAPSSSSSLTSPQNEIGLNKVCFDKEGKKIATGSSDGRVFVYEVDERFFPHEDDRATFQKMLAQNELMNEKKLLDDRIAEDM